MTPSCNYESLQKSLNDLKGLEKIFNESENRRIQRIRELDSEIELLVKNRFKGKKSILDSYKSGKQTSMSILNEYYRIEREAVQEVQRLLEFLVAIRGSYWSEGGVMTFEKDEYVEEYNDCILNLLELIKEEEIILKKLELYQQSLADKWASSNI